ncbi:Pectin acetylesterase [Heracleum sosnowskyi]|uniref:Pectin acetylesterase n=1 Tax=Heracleum sosnowskyi TaxID=360622 RepID=A0AAD8MGW7_9APIA|nr:Pectin acetylesterase [Heracleum sosnowskyi]
MASGRLAPWVVFILSVLQTESVDVTNTILKNAVEKGAVCLDGTPPAYALHEGKGDAANNWVIYLEGGGWCATEAECLFRTTKDAGSSKRWQKERSSLIAMLSDNQKENPYFYNWTRVYVRYCDGSSYVGDREKPFVGNNTSVYFRGARVFNAIMEDLLEQGMKSASKALLTGCSAGGLGALLQCDNFRSILPSSAKVKCAADAGFFIDGTDIYGGHLHREHFAQIVQTHESQKNLPKSCTSKMDASLCMLPQNFVADIQTPLFVVNSVYDTWQIDNILMPMNKNELAAHDQFVPCGHDIENCTCDQVTLWRGFQAQFYQALPHFNSSSSNGMFINACASHCQTQKQETWFGDSNISKLRDTTSGPLQGVGEAVGEWFVNDATVRKVDHRTQSPLVCEYNPEEPHWNNYYTFRGTNLIISTYTMADEIKRKLNLVPQCPAKVLHFKAPTLCFGAF